MANLLPAISVDLGGLTVPRPGEQPSEAYRRLQGDGSAPPGTPAEVVQMFDDGGDPALSGPAPVFSDTDPTTLRKTPTPDDPLAEKPAKPWWDLSEMAPPPPAPPKLEPWMVKGPTVSPEQRKRDASRFDPTLLDALFGSGTGRLNVDEQRVEQDKRRAVAEQADLTNRLMKEQEAILRAGNPDPYAGTTFLGTNVPVTSTGDRNAADKKAKAAGPEATLKTWRDFTERSVQSFLNGLVSLPKGAGIAVDGTRYTLGRMIHGNPNLTPNALVQTMDRISQDIQKALPGDPTRNDEFIGQLGSGGGSMLSFLVGGAVAKAIGLPVKIGTALTGASVGGAQAYDEAIAYGADLPTRYLAFLVGAGLGTTEAIPIDRALRRLNDAGGGVVTRVLASAMANSLEEMIQEVGQQIGQNAMARVLYDNSREIFAGVADAGLVAAVLGGLFGGGSQAVNAVTNRIGAPQKPVHAPPAGEGQSGQGAAEPAQQPAVAPTTGKLNDMAGPLAGTDVEIIEKTTDGSGYMVKMPDGQTTFTGVKTVDVAPVEQTSQQAAAPEDVSMALTPGADVAEKNMHGFEPSLRVKAPALEESLPVKPLFTQATTNRNAEQQVGNIDPVLDKFPELNTEEDWARMLSYALRSDEVPVPPFQFIDDMNNTDQVAEQLAKLTAGQIADTDHGFQNARSIYEAYTSGQATVEDTGKIFLWSFLSRGVSPYTQESLFLDAFPGVDEWIQKAARGVLSKDELPAYDAWTRTVAPKGSGQPGAGATHNLAAFGRDFLFKMGQKGPDGLTHLQKLHDMMADPQMTGQQIRREFLKFGEGVGIDNKVVSFTLLVSGRPDVMVLDRVQIRRLWNDGRFGDRNLYDTRTDAEGKQLTGTALSEITYGARGLLIYEAIERELGKKVQEIYTKIGRAKDASIGRYHWETWVADSGQEASHATLDAVGRQIQKSDAPLKDLFAKQGEYGAYEYGARYGRDVEGKPVFLYSVPGDQTYRFPVPQFRAFLEAVKKPANKVIPTKFKVTEAGNAPWYYRPEVNRQALAELAAKFGRAEPGNEGVRGNGQEASAGGSVGDVSAIQSPQRPRANYPLERTRPAGGIPEQRALPAAEVTPSKTDITTRFKDAIDLVVKQGRFGQGASKAEAIYKWGQSVARVKSEGQMLELFHEGGHHLHSRLEPLVDAAIDKHQAEIYRIADTLYGGGGVLKMSDTVARRREGFATFFQVYMNNPAEARVIAPGFLPAFEQLMEQNSPGIKSELDAIRQEVEAWLTSKSSAQLARERVVSNKKLGTVGKIVESIKNGTLLHDTATLANRVYQATMNDQHPLTLAVRSLYRIAEENIRVQIERGLLNRQQALAELEKLTRRGRSNPVKMAALARNAYNASSEVIASGVAKYGGDGSAVTKGIPEILQKAMGAGRFRLEPQTYEDFNTYLAMRRIVTEWRNYYATLAWDRAKNLGAAALNPNAAEPPVKRFRRPDDISLGDAQQAIADIERANPTFGGAATDLYDYLDALLQYKVDAGIITQEMADKQRQIADYVPLRRDMGDEKGGLGNGKDAKTGKDNLLRVFKGSDRRILSPIESVMQMTHETMAMIAKNDVKRAMVDLALDVGRGSGAVVEKIPATAMKGTGYKLSEVLKAAGDFSLAEEIAQAMGRDEISMQEFLDEVLDGDEAGTIWRKADINEKGEPIIYVWRNGEMEAFTLNDQEWADDLYSALTELGKEQQTLFLNVMGKPAAILRAGVTTAPPFFIANLIRDQVSAWVLNDGVYPGYSLGKGMASDLFDRKARRLYNLSMANIGGSNIQALDKTRFGTEQTMLAKAGIGITVEQSLNTALRAIDSSETWGRQGIWQAAYKKAIADGLSPADAMIEAGFEATDYANYGRAGSKMLYVRRLVTFLNANLQGLDKSVRTALGSEAGAAWLRKELAPWVRRQISPAFAARLGLEGSTTALPLTAQERAQVARAGRTVAKMMSLAIPSALLSMLYWDDEEYQEMSPYMKGTRWMVKLAPGKWLAIPKPFQLAVFATWVEYGIQSTIGNDPLAMQNFMKSQLAVIAPPYENPGLKLFYELQANKNLFTDREIVPGYIQARPAWLQYDEYTSEFGKLMGRFTGQSPMLVDHVITSSFATWGRGFLTASNLLNPNRQSQGLDDFAFTSYFIKDGSRSSTVRPAFFDLVGQTNGKLKGAYDGYKQLMDAGADGQANELLSQLSEDQRAFALLYYHQEVDAKRLHPLRNAYDIVQTISGMRKEIAFNRLREGGKDDGAILTLSPTQQKLLNDRLSDLQVRLQRNALIAVGEPGFAQRKMLPTLPLIDQIKAVDPRVATDLRVRLGNRVYATDAVARMWPEVKAAILAGGEKANLRPFVLKAKGAGKRIWTGAEQ